MRACVQDSRVWQIGVRQRQAAALGPDPGRIAGSQTATGGAAERKIGRQRTRLHVHGRDDSVPHLTARFSVGPDESAKLAALRERPGNHDRRLKRRNRDGHRLPGLDHGEGVRPAALTTGVSFAGLVQPVAPA